MPFFAGSTKFLKKVYREEALLVELSSKCPKNDPDDGQADIDFAQQRAAKCKCE